MVLANISNEAIYPLGSTKEHEARSQREDTDGPYNFQVEPCTVGMSLTFKRRQDLGSQLLQSQNKKVCAMPSLGLGLIFIFGSNCKEHFEERR